MKIYALLKQNYHIITLLNKLVASPINDKLFPESSQECVYYMITHDNYPSFAILYQILKIMIITICDGHYGNEQRC